MRITTPVLTGTKKPKIADISPDAAKRLKWFDYYATHGKNGRLTCRYFGISPQTFYRWKRRYDSQYLPSLEDHSHQPRHLRQPTWSQETAQTVLKLREQFPRWGKDKLAELFRQQGQEISSSMVGRILRYLKNRGLLKEPPLNRVSARKRLRPRPFAIRKPKDYPVNQNGDIIQLDTLDLRPLPGVLLKHFTAHDVVSKWNVMSVHSQATSSTAAHFLNTILERMPFPVKAIQVDGGSEFEAFFEKECQRRGIRLFVLPPRSPKLNGGVERAHRTHTEEFYEVTDSTFDLADLRQKLLEWEHTYNTIRPHQALGYLTPLKFLEMKGGIRCH